MVLLLLLLMVHVLLLMLLLLTSQVPLSSILRCLFHLIGSSSSPPVSPCSFRPADLAYDPC
jgi:hypothetical protein